MNKFTIAAVCVALAAGTWLTRAEIFNVAENGTATTTSPLWAPGKWSIRKLIDGDTQGVFHLDTAPDAGAAYLLDLGKDYAIQELRIYPRQDGCCPERLTNFRVSVHKDNNGKIGDLVWKADLFTDGSNPSSGPGIVVTLTKDLDAAHPFAGHWVKIQTLENPVQDYALQMTELEVYGRLSSPLRPVLGHVRTGNGVRLSWSAGNLESVPEASGPYAPVTGAASPYDVAPSGSRRFFRLRQ